MHVQRPAPAQPRRSGPLPVPQGRRLGSQQQRLPDQRLAPVPRRGQPSRVRDRRVRQHPPAHHARPCRRAHPRGTRRRCRASAARGGGVRRHLPVQEQHRLRGQLLRLPRELPGGAARRVRAPGRALHPLPHHPAAGRGRGQGPPDAPRGRLLPEPAGRPHVGGRVERDDTVPPHHQHPRRAACRRRPLPAPACHRRRQQHERDHHDAQGRHRRPRPAHARGRRGHARHDLREPDQGHSRDEP